MSHDLFRIAVEEVLRHEGGLVEHPDDPGGLTNFGISQASYPHLDIRAMTREQAAEIYRLDFWEPLHGYKLPPALALALFDAGVNMGKVRAIKILQAALGVKTDGIIGPKTISAAIMAPMPWTLTDFMARRLFAYGTFRHFQQFGLGWSRRCLEVYARALVLMADGQWQ